MQNPPLSSLLPATWDSLQEGDICYIHNLTNASKPWVAGPFRVIEPGLLYNHKCLIAAAWYAKEPCHVSRQRTFVPDQREMSRLRILK